MTIQQSPTDLARALRANAEAIVKLAGVMARAQDTQEKDDAVAAEQAAYGTLRISPEMLRQIARLQNTAEDIVKAARDRRDALMKGLYGPDSE